MVLGLWVQTALNGTKPFVLSRRLVEEKSLFAQIQLLESNSINVGRLSIDAEPVRQSGGGRLPVNVVGAQEDTNLTQVRVGRLPLGHLVPNYTFSSSNGRGSSLIYKEH